MDGTPREIFSEVESLQKIVRMEETLASHVNDIDVLREAKKMGFSDRWISKVWHLEETELHGVAGEAVGRLGATAGFTSVPLMNSASDSQFGLSAGPVARTARRDEIGEKR